MEMETLLVFLSGIYTKKVSRSATLIKDSKVKLSTYGLTTFNVQQVDVFVCFPSYPMHLLGWFVQRLFVTRTLE